MRRTLVWLGIGYMIVIMCYFAWNDIQSGRNHQINEPQQQGLTTEEIGL